MNGIDLLRHAIAAFIKANGNSFTVLDFRAHKNASCYLQKMETNGELVCLGTKSKHNRGKPVKIYRMLALNDGKVKAKPVDRLIAWKRIWPDLFTEPDFSGYETTVRTNVIMV